MVIFTKMGEEAGCLDGEKQSLICDLFHSNSATFVHGHFAEGYFFDFQEELSTSSYNYSYDLVPDD
jgi:hypothetical protein